MSTKNYGNYISGNLNRVSQAMFCNRLDCDENDRKLNKVKTLLEEAERIAKSMENWQPEPFIKEIEGYEYV